MFSRKLKALGYHHPEHLNLNDEKEFRSCIIWLENQKIRLYKVEEREFLNNIDNKAWQSALDTYLNDLHCPVDKNNKFHILGWLLSHAIRLEYNENAVDFNSKHAERLNRKHVSQNENGNTDNGSLNDITSDNPDLKAGIASISKLLSLPHHFDHITILQAICSLIEQRLNETNINESRKSSEKKKNKAKEGDYLPLNEVNLGFSTNDSAINEAGKILRLLNIHELRDLQTKINQAIVSVQRKTANPKTDQSLGKVGR